MLNRITAVAVCDATVLNRYSAVGYINKKTPGYRLGQYLIFKKISRYQRRWPQIPGCILYLRKPARSAGVILTGTKRKSQLILNNRQACHAVLSIQFVTTKRLIFTKYSRYFYGISSISRIEHVSNIYRTYIEEISKK
jgi:hypothetical protein